MDQLKSVVGAIAPLGLSIEEIAKTPKLEELEEKLKDEVLKSEFSYVEELLYEIQGQLRDLKIMKQAIEGIAVTLYTGKLEERIVALEAR